MFDSTTKTGHIHYFATKTNYSSKASRRRLVNTTLLRVSHPNARPLSASLPKISSQQVAISVSQSRLSNITIAGYSTKPSSVYVIQYPLNVLISLNAQSNVVGPDYLAPLDKK